jgi:hypothetical protein
LRFIAGLGSATAWPVVGRAQQAAVPVIGYLSAGSANATISLEAYLKLGLFRRSRFLGGGRPAPSRS